MATTAFPSPQIPLPFARAEVVLTGDMNQLPCWYQLSRCKSGQLSLTPLQSHSIIKDSLKRTRPPRPIFLLKDAATALRSFLPRPPTLSWNISAATVLHCLPAQSAPASSSLTHDRLMYHPVFQEPLLYKWIPRGFLKDVNTPICNNWCCFISCTGT